MVSSWVLKDQFFSEENMYRKLKEFAAKDGLEETDRAIDYALEQHRLCFRNVSEFATKAVPYIIHPFMMACHAHALGIRDDVVMAVALLHDICEDCGVSPGELPFSDAVRDGVERLTKTGKDKESYYRRIMESSIASVVKALDRCNNISTMMLSFSRDRVIAYIEETEKYSLPLLDHIKHEYPQYYDVAFALKYQIRGLLESAKATIMRGEKQR